MIYIELYSNIYIYIYMYMQLYTPITVFFITTLVTLDG